MARVVLVTGISRDLAARFARELAVRSDVEVIGVDVVPPRFDIGRARYVRADIRNAGITRVMAAEAVETVVHLGVKSTPANAGGRSLMKEINVIGTMQLLASCQRSQTVRRLIVQSSASVYGASPRDPARFTEEMTARAGLRTGFGKDSVEIESYVGGLARRRPDLIVTTLRLANLMGARVDSSITRYLSLPLVPRPMGFEARLQFLHPTDAVRALLLAVDRELPGTFNVAAPDLITLSQALAVVGRPGLPVPGSATAVLAAIGRQARILDLSADQIAALTYGRGMDTTRFRAVAGFVPEIGSRAALEEFAVANGPGPLRHAEELIDKAAALAGGRSADVVAGQGSGQDG
ncbi:MAG TPA: NAD-dependent epimerase/dehydratase family protein [Microlunatus sp.]